MAKKKETSIAPIDLADGAFPSLHDLLRKDDKKGLFDRSTASLGMPTGFLPLDYRNGYKMKVFGHDDLVVSEYNNIGIFGGTFNTIIGKTGTAKTTLATQMAANISRYFEKKFGKYAEIYHLDAEQASNYTRTKTLTNFTIDELDQRYHLNQESTFIEDIFTIFKQTADMKEAYKQYFTVNTGIKNEFNEDITCYVPTIFIVDSLPSISIREGDEKKNEELQTGTYANRVAKAISRFYKTTIPWVKKYNFIVFVINHINQKITMGTPTSPQTMYLKMDESLPGGVAPLYYAHNIFKIVAAEKRLVDKHGFDGFRARIELLKSRSNKAGKFCHLIYNQEIGFDPYASLYDYLNEDCKLVEGRNPYRYIAGFDNIKFDDRKFGDEVRNNQELYKALYATSSTALDDILSNSKFNPVDSPTDVTHLFTSLSESYANDETIEP